MGTDGPDLTFADLLSFFTLLEFKICSFTTPETPRVHHHLPVTGTRHVKADDTSPNSL